MKRILLLFSIFCLLSCKSLGTNEHLIYKDRPQSKVYSVAIKDFQFVPSSLDLELGATIVFTNLEEQSIPHNVYPTEDSDFQFQASDILNPGESFTLRIDRALDAEIYCDIHPSMPGLSISVHERGAL